MVFCWFGKVIVWMNFCSDGEVVLNIMMIVVELVFDLMVKFKCELKSVEVCRCVMVLVLVVLFVIFLLLIFVVLIGVLFMCVV